MAVIVNKKTLALIFIAAAVATASFYEDYDESPEAFEEEPELVLAQSERPVVMPMKAVGMALEADDQERVLKGVKKNGSHEFTVPENLMGTQWYADYKNWLKIDTDGKYICWPVGCVKAKCARNTGVNQAAANREMRRIQTLKNCDVVERRVKISDYKRAVAKARELKRKEKAAKKKERADKAAKRERKAKADEKRAKELSAKEKAAKEKADKVKREKSDKEKNAKEKAAKVKKEKADKVAEKAEKERSTKELSKKEKASKEKAKKENDAKIRAEKDTKAKKERKAKADEKDAKEKAKKEKAKAAELKKKESSAKAKERTDKESRAREGRGKAEEKQAKELKTKEVQQKKISAEKTNKQKSERRGKNTCTLTAYEHNNYRGRALSRVHTCTSKRSYHLPKSGRRRGYQASSFRLSSGCRQVQLWDEDACRENYGDNVNIRSSVASVKWDLNDDICAVTVWANRNGWC